MNLYPYVREKEENSDWKFNRLEKLLVPGHLATWTLSHLSRLSRNVSTGKNIGPKLSVYGVSTEKYFGSKCTAAQRLAEIRKIILERGQLECDSSAVNQTPRNSQTLTT